MDFESSNLNKEGMRIETEFPEEPRLRIMTNKDVHIQQLTVRNLDKQQ